MKKVDHFSKIYAALYVPLELPPPHNLSVYGFIFVYLVSLSTKKHILSLCVICNSLSVTLLICADLESFNLFCVLVVTYLYTTVLCSGISESLGLLVYQIQTEVNVELKPRPQPTKVNICI